MNDTKISQIKHDKHSINATGKVLGRLATEVATLLTGKNKPYFVRHLDCGDFVEVTNATNIKITGSKENTKLYTHFSGFPGGLKTTSLKTLKENNPTQVVRKAITGMLPNNKLKKFWEERLTIKI